jgi:hypothetical protein
MRFGKKKSDGKQRPLGSRSRVPEIPRFVGKGSLGIPSLGMSGEYKDI